MRLWGRLLGVWRVQEAGELAAVRVPQCRWIGFIRRPPTVFPVSRVGQLRWREREGGRLWKRLKQLFSLQGKAQM